VPPRLNRFQSIPFEAHWLFPKQLSRTIEQNHNFITENEYPFTNKPDFRLTVVLLCLAVLASASKADAQTPVSGKQAAGIIAVLIGAAAGVGVGVYLLVRSPRKYYRLCI
jgi:hypothetical protein